MIAAILNCAMLDSDTAYLGFRHLVIFSQIHSKTLSLLSDCWIKLIESDSNSIILTWIDTGSHLEFCHLEFWPCWIQPFCTKFWPKLFQSDSNSFILTQPDDGSHVEFCHVGFSHFTQNKLHSFILTHLNYGSHLEFCHVGFRHCHLGFRYLVIFSQIHSKTLSLHSDADST